MLQITFRAMAKPGSLMIVVVLVPLFVVAVVQQRQISDLQDQVGELQTRSQDLARGVSLLGDCLDTLGLVQHRRRISGVQFDVRGTAGDTPKEL